MGAGTSEKTKGETGSGQGPKPLGRRRLVKRAKDLVREARGLLKRKGKKLEEPEKAAVQAVTDAVAATLATGRGLDVRRLDRETLALDEALTKHMGHFRKSVLRELVEAVAWAIGLALIIRFFLIEAFSIPTSSMIPTLQIGDHLFVNKIGYGIYVPLSPARLLSWDEPERGEIIVFKYVNPNDSSHNGEDFIKRVVAGPGDKVRLVDNVLYINDEAVPTEVLGEMDCGMFHGDNAEVPDYFCRCVRQKETVNGIEYVTQHIIGPMTERCALTSVPSWPLHDRPRTDYIGDAASNAAWPNVVVPEGHVMVMGDNRDCSHDSRFWGFVPFDRIKGSAFLLWWARDTSRIFNWLE